MARAKRMTVDDLFDWIMQQRLLAAESGQEIGSYEVVCFTEGQAITETKIDHGRNMMDVGW